MNGPKHNGDVPLPVANRQRWQPIRGGLLNMYRYDYQEFRYEDGRLLLRGNNGTGKSRVLALQLPFLLDGAEQLHNRCRRPFVRHPGLGRHTDDLPACFGDERGRVGALRWERAQLPDRTNR